MNQLKVIIGLGKTGISCIHHLIKLNCNIAVVDSRLNPPKLREVRQQFPQIPIHLGSFNENILFQAQELIISPGVSLSEPVIISCLKRGVKVIGDIELFARATQIPIIAITGSNGKSTVTSLVGEMIIAAGKRVGIGGNLGIPALELLEQKVDFYVLELSSFQLENTYSLKAMVATILNISPDHLDRYQNFNSYLQAKQRIYTNCHSAVINRDNYLSYAQINLPHKVISFGDSRPNIHDFGIDQDYLMIGNEKILSLSQLKIKGLHNATNALAALALCKAIGLPLQKTLNALCSFSGLPHRGQWVANVNGVDWYNDSKGTNVGATVTAIEGFGKNIKGKIILIAGGVGKNADFSPLQIVVAKYVKTVVLIGKDALLIQQALIGSSEILLASSLSDAVILCAKEAVPGDVVLLSPACASYDMFHNFEHRGSMFMREVENRVKLLT
jgi:UDP-N-acetylmuramoylalanine--D-glutamate ligase